MKQQYQSPSTKVFSVEIAHIICGSNERLNPKQGTWGSQPSYGNEDGYDGYEGYDNY